MPRPVRTVLFRTDREDAAVYLRRTWEGPAVVMGATPTSVVVTRVPDRATVPLGDNLGPVSRARAEATIRGAAPYAADVYVVEVLSPSGERRYGMFAVPYAAEPSFGVW